MAGDLNARSPWEHIGGTIVMGGLGLLFFDATLGAAALTIGAVCIWLGWRDFKRKHADEAEGDPGPDGP